MNKRLYCLKDHTLATIGTQCGALFFSLAVFELLYKSARSVQCGGSLWVQGFLQGDEWTEE